MRNGRKEVLGDAWIGDAVLSLYARLRILRGDGVLDSEKFIRMTSNQFLATMGEPSEVEAEIGRVFERDGLDAAYRWIEAKLMPMFERQEANRMRRGRK
jgi:23S rRNA maturation mini-RNase III